MPGAPRLEVVILVGLQASGKTRFFAERLEPSHAHVSFDQAGHALGQLEGGTQGSIALGWRLGVPVGR